MLSVSAAYFLYILIDKLSTGNMDNYYIYILYYVLLVLFKSFIYYLKSKLKGDLFTKVSSQLKSDLYSKIMCKRTKDYYSESTANYMSLLNNDASIITNEYFANILLIIEQISMLIISTLALIKLNALITIGIFSIAILTTICNIMFGQKMNTKQFEYSSALELFTVKIKSIFSGFEVIKSFNISQKAKSDFESANTSVRTSYFSLIKIAKILETLLSFLGESMFIIIMLIGGYFVQKRVMTVGMLMMSMQLMQNILSPISLLGVSFTQLSSCKSICNKLNNTLNIENKEDKSIKKDIFSNKITFSNVKFAYSNNQILNNISFKIEKGCKCAIIGFSGSGKSTLLKLLQGYYDDYEGKILIDDTELKDINSKSINNLISTIHQNIYMFDDTIENNITLYNTYDKNDIDNVIKQCNLEELIRRQNSKANNNIGEDGNQLSGGEKQRISIARTIIKKSPIVLFDEVTSNLDNINSSQIENMILNMNDVTCIYVTHKINPSILKQFDLIITLRDGQIVEMDKYDNLISNNGYFYSLVNSTKDN